MTDVKSGTIKTSFYAISFMHVIVLRFSKEIRSNDFEFCNNDYRFEVSNPEYVHLFNFVGACFLYRFRSVFEVSVTNFWY